MNQNNLYSLSKVFTERLFRIPDYQRGYAWSTQQLDDFWDDLQSLHYDSVHYVGLITLEDISNDVYSRWSGSDWIITSKGYKPYYVVDGQQRLTTAVILIQCILDMAKTMRMKQINYSSIESLKMKFIEDYNPSKLSKAHIFSYEETNDSSQYLENVILGSSKKSNEMPFQTVYTKNLLDAKLYFQKKLKGYKQKDVELLFKKLTQNLVFNLYTVSSDLDVCLTFETMNNRGKPLSHLELLKNRLIYLSTLLLTDVNDRKSIRFQINDCWKDLYRYLGQDRSNALSDDLFLYNHYLLYYGLKSEIKQKRNFRYGLVYEDVINPFNEEILNDTFSRNRIFSADNKITTEEIQKYVENIKTNVKLWRDIFKPDESNYSSYTRLLLERLLRIGANNDTYILIFSVLCKIKEEDKYNEFLSVLERLTFVNSFDPNYDREWDSIKTLAVKLFNEEINITELMSDLNGRLRQLVDSNSFVPGLVRRFSNHGFYRWKTLNHIMYEYEVSLQGKSKNATPKLIISSEKFNDEDYLTIEHILPQTIRDDYWKQRFGKFTNEEKNILKNTIGNLVCVSRQKNSKLSNKPFDYKKNHSGEQFGFQFGSYSEIEICENDEWTAKEILDRGLRLLNFIEEHWQLKFGNRNDKIDILGLNFLEDKYQNKYT